MLAAEPMITEFMASNGSVLRDGDGNSSDWVEIYNPSDSPIDLGGYRLTDKPDQLSRWVFPQVTVEPREYLVVFASGQSVDDYVDAGGSLHTNFALKASGEYLSLVSPDGPILSEFRTEGANFPQQRRNISYGLAHSVDLINAASDTYYIVPSDDSSDANWTQRSFDERASGFLIGKPALGMEDEPDIRDHLADEIITELPPRSFGVYTRTHFTLEDPAAISELNLRLKYDDGFAAYLNGNLVASDNAPDRPSWFSTAPESRVDDRDALVFNDWDLTDFRNHLVRGDNVLAIHGLNNVPRGQGDMLLAFELSAVIPSISQSGYMPEPTPGFANNGVLDGLVADTQFSLARGFHDAPQTLEITTATEGAQIYYSTDGSNPEPNSANAMLYNEPLTIDETTVIRAAAYKSGLVPTVVNTRTFLFVNDVVDQPAMKPVITNDPVWRPRISESLLSVPSVSLVTSEPIAEGVTFGELKASVELIHPDGTEGFQVDAEIEHFGGATLKFSNKKNIRISFKGTYGVSRLEYDLFGDGAVDEFDQLLLHTGSHDSWFFSHHPSGNRGIYIRNRWATDTQREMGQPAPHGRFVQVYMNGQYWGMHSLMERPNGAFMASYFGGDKEDYDALNGLTAVDGDLSAWQELTRLAEGNDYDALRRYLDVENYADYMLLQFYGGNDFDWNPGNNWMASRQRAGSQGYKFFPWDSDMVLRSPNANVINEGGPGGLWNSVSKFKEFRVLLADRIQKHFFDSGLLTSERVLEKLNSLEDEVRLPIIAETARWTGTNGTADYTPDTWREQVNNVRDGIIKTRTEVVIGQLRRAGLFPELAAPTVLIDGQPHLDGRITNQAKIELVSSEGTAFYTLDDSDPRTFGGDVSPLANIYSTAFEVTSGQVLKARVVDGGQWSPLREVVLQEPIPDAAGKQTVQGDSNNDGVFDQLDIVQVLQASKYQTGTRAEWTDGDWNGDGVFDRLDIVAALQSDCYLQETHAVDQRD